MSLDTLSDVRGRAPGHYSHPFEARGIKKLPGCDQFHRGGTGCPIPLHAIAQHPFYDQGSI